MIRSSLYALATLLAVLWAPLWLQGIVFIVGIIFLPVRVLLLIPAIVSDVLYASTVTLRFSSLRMTLLVGFGIVFWILILRYTRLLYVVSSK